jgi:hypothetical protein
MDHPFKTQIAAKLFEEILEAVSQAQQYKVSSLHHWDLLRCYAELQFRLHGNSRCSICNAAVRHRIPVQVERADGRVDAYECLCTRCYEGERGQCKKIVKQVGDARVEQGPRETSRPTTDFHTQIAGQTKAS